MDLRRRPLPRKEGCWAMKEPTMLPYWLQHILVEWPWLQDIFFRYRCPYPIDGHKSARACFMAGHCGCDNQNRFR